MDHWPIGGHAGRPSIPYNWHFGSGEDCTDLTRARIPPLGKQFFEDFKEISVRRVEELQSTGLPLKIWSGSILLPLRFPQYSWLQEFVASKRRKRTLIGLLGVTTDNYQRIFFCYGVRNSMLVAIFHGAPVAYVQRAFETWLTTRPVPMIKSDNVHFSSMYSGVLFKNRLLIKKFYPLLDNSRITDTGHIELGVEFS